MKSKRTLAVALLVVLLVCGLLLWRGSQMHETETGAGSAVSNSPSSNPASPQSVSVTASNDVVIPDLPGVNLSADDKANIARIVKAFSAPISFWGKVVDQNGEPVAGARIHYSAQDKYFGDSTSSYGSSDSEGKFSVSGLKGAGLFISVAKEGYYGTPKSGGSFGYGTPSGNAPPSADNPVVLLLHKRGECEPLVDLEPGSIMLPKDGVPVTVSLRARRLGTARTASPDVVFELRSDDKNPDERRRFDWSLRITAPGGGLLPRVGIFNFTAPADGYQSEIVINMPKSEEKWRVQWRSDFFVRLGDGCFARFEIFAAPRGGFVDIHSYLNPVPGHRNLEFDPAKAIKPAE